MPGHRLISSYLHVFCALVMVMMVASCVPAANPTTAARNIASPATATSVEKVQPPSAATSTAVVSAPPATQDTMPPASTETPTPAPTKKANALPTAALPVPMGYSKPAVSAWCLNEDTAVTYATSNPLHPKVNVKPSSVKDDVIEIRNLPSNGCVFLYTFEQSAPAGLSLDIYETKVEKPFLTVDLTPDASEPNVTWGLVRHTAVTSPPEKGISLVFVVRDPLGQQLRRDTVNLYHWVQPTPEPRQPEEEDCGCTIPLP